MSVSVLMAILILAYFGPLFKIMQGTKVGLLLVHGSSFGGMPFL